MQNQTDTMRELSTEELDQVGGGKGLASTTGPANIGEGVGDVLAGVGDTLNGILSGLGLGGALGGNL